MKKFIPFFVLIIVSAMGCTKKNAIETEQFTVYEVTYLTDEKTDSLLVSFEIEFPTALADDSVLSVVQQSLLDKLFGARYVGMSVEESMHAFIAMYQTEYINNNKVLKEQLSEEYAEEEGLLPFFCEEDHLAARVISLTGNVFSYGIEQYVYMGGAHGVSNRFFYNYDLTTGALLAETDLFIENYRSHLIQLLRDNLIAQNDEFESESDLSESDYELEKIVPNNNFYITDEGITWVFNPYDIAPYAYGETEITVPVAQIRALLLPDVELWK
ncbi:MAG: DUF3298 and DUF4163 domain-containing protein [Paludibacter sp.]|nr:DUF3298 and DUF4163 domain-containing protein [Bacteroidales bacterium]MCM1068317.1 DUF3298 and DUF4163 domain-containing protein [Prevotella sp.]MCM1354056.1 DUF3298 and DUF4163 domain-containing protein [Bacteroides sp.]MCM1442102.1 DUF3298 and DUF4163 domain-containing protein [Muribaculum sp.]MCM1482004.1 DUF3298 and DUF4163 domain-containing protein [Paludibacter sp.]